MTQQPFSRPGAIDLSGLGRPPAPQQAAPSAGAGSAGGAYSVAISQDNFQQVLQESMTAPVVMVFHSARQAPGSEQYAADVAAEAERLEGRLLAALVDVDTNPEIAQAMQIPQVPLTMVILDGRPVTQPIPGALSPDEIATLFSQLGQQLTTQGISGRHQPRQAVAAAGEEAEEEAVDPRYAPAQDALGRGD